MFHSVLSGGTLAPPGRTGRGRTLSKQRGGNYLISLNPHHGTILITGCYACTAMYKKGFHYGTSVTAFGKLFNALIDVLITIFTCHPIVFFTLAHHLKYPSSSPALQALRGLHALT